ncbi:DUF4352 domain-containing protein [Agathobacter sp. LCP21S3_B2]|uniref:DUF4352 domain-containing protein n=1 Tax=Agathobacter sp. LCP21S3_B2 TaxID=3438734 RepID=UPI003F8F7B18
MTGKRIKIMASVLAVATVMTGCGTKIYDMTDEEQQLIVNYSAYALSKHNIYQPDGMTSVTEAETEEQDTSAAETADEKTSEKTDTGHENGNSSQSQQTAQETKPTMQTVSLAQAIGYDGLSVSYAGLTTEETYKEGSYYSMEAGAGNTYAVLKFTLSNTTGTDMNVDLFTKTGKYRAAFSGGKEYEAEGSFLTYALNTFQGTIAAGQSVDVVLLFKVPQDTVCDSVTMSVEKDNVKNLIAL